MIKNTDSVVIPLSKLALFFCPFCIVWYRSTGIFSIHYRDLMVVDYDCKDSIALKDIEQIAVKNPDQLWYLYLFVSLFEKFF